MLQYYLREVKAIYIKRGIHAPVGLNIKPDTQSIWLQKIIKVRRMN